MAMQIKLVVVVVVVVVVDMVNSKITNFGKFLITKSSQQRFQHPWELSYGLAEM